MAKQVLWGTELTFRPGLVAGGSVTHKCSGRAVGYFLEPLVSLALFGKRELVATLTGVTNDDRDVSVDACRMALLPRATLLLALLPLLLAAAAPKHLLVVVIDDLGFDDVGFRSGDRR